MACGPEKNARKRGATPLNLGDSRIGPAKTSHSHHKAAEIEQGSGRQAQHVETLGENVLAEIARGQLVAPGSGLAEEFPVEQVHLAKVGLIGVAANAGPMLDQRPSVGITKHAESSHESDRLRPLLAEPVKLVSADGDNEGDT